MSGSFKELLHIQARKTLPFYQSLGSGLWPDLADECWGVRSVTTHLQSSWVPRDTLSAPVYPRHAKSLLHQLCFGAAERGEVPEPRVSRARAGGRGLTRSLALALQVFFQVWPPGPSHEETPLNGSRGESCGLRGVKVEEPWAEGCVFQPKHAILHPTQLPPGPHFLEGLLRANKSCKNGIATTVRDVWGFLDSYTGI